MAHLLASQLSAISRALPHAAQVDPVVSHLTGDDSRVDGSAPQHLDPPWFAYTLAGSLSSAVGPEAALIV